MFSGFGYLNQQILCLYQQHVVFPQWRLFVVSNDFIMQNISLLEIDVNKPLTVQAFLNT